MFAQTVPVDQPSSPPPLKQQPLMGNIVSGIHEKHLGITRKPVLLQQQVDSGKASPISDHQPDVGQFSAGQTAQRNTLVGGFTSGPGQVGKESVAEYASRPGVSSGIPGLVNDLPVPANQTSLPHIQQYQLPTTGSNSQQLLGSQNQELNSAEKDLLGLQSLSIQPQSVQQYAQTHSSTPSTMMPDVAIYHVSDEPQPAMYHDGMSAQIEYMGGPGPLLEHGLEELPLPLYPNQYPPPPQRFHPQDLQQPYWSGSGLGPEERSDGSLPRPRSTNTLASSSNSDGVRHVSHAAHLSVGAQTPSPMTSPMLRPQNRYSPEHRPQSYIDLLKTPYAQQVAPSPNLDNSFLRQIVGTNASLMEASKTLDAYRANVKNIPDPAIQYEFAVFMVQTALELDPEAPGPVDRDGLIRDARQILQKLVDKSYPFAQYYLADGYASGLFNKGKEDYDRAFPLFQAAAKRGHAEAAYRAALCYELGWGCRKDYNKAVKFYEMSASKNHPGAATRLGLACLNDMMGLSNKYREGCKWLKRAAESADAQYNAAPYELAKLHENGFGPDIFKDEAYAAQLFTESANLGHPDANLVMGKAYEHGYLGCPQDAMLSIHFYTGAAQSGEPEGMMALTAWYLFGAPPLLAKDDNEAFEWAKRAADCGKSTSTPI
jgi:TPR repeat protein